MEKKNNNIKAFANVPNTVIDEIHKILSKRSHPNAVRFAPASKKVRHAIQQNRLEPHLVTNNVRKFLYPEDQARVGSREVKELKQRLSLLFKFVLSLQRDKREFGHLSRRKRMATIKNTFYEILEMYKNSFDTILKKHISFAFTTGNRFGADLSSPNLPRVRNIQNTNNNEEEGDFRHQ